jgi:hypothetical protein
VKGGGEERHKKLLQVLAPGAIIRELFRTKEYNAICQSKYCASFIGMIKILRYTKLTCIKLQCCNIKSEPFWG